MSRLEQLRKIRAWTRLDLATRAGLTESTIVRAERTDPPALQARTLEKIARAFDVPMGELLAAPSDEGGHPLRGDRPDPDVLFVHDLALAVRISVRRIRALLKTEPWKLPERLPALDKRDRWSRIAVDKWLESRELDRKRRTSAALVRG